MNWRGWFRPKAAPRTPPLNPTAQPVALNLPQDGPAAVNAGTAAREAALGRVAVPDRTLDFRGHRWRQGGPETAKGTVRFVREIAVEGRAVETEVEVRVDDLDLQPDGVLRLRGR